ncbi:MAG: hypothetical protein LAT57_00015 [Balneolales bacterium]|nr:hypothetical protein [Balneolales bacterium]
MHHNVDEAKEILRQFGMPRGQLNDRTAYCLLALLNMRPGMKWSECESPLIGVTPIMFFTNEYYDYKYAPNSRESVRKGSLHQMIAAGIVLYNPDEPDRPVNSPKNVYQIESNALALIRTYGSKEWEPGVKSYMKKRPGLAAKYAMHRDLQKLPVRVRDGLEINLSPGSHSVLIKAIIEEFAPRYAPGSELVYAGDTKSKWDAYFDKEILEKLGVKVGSHGKMPDVVLYYTERKWLLLCESVTSHGPVDSKRHSELAELFKDCKAGLVYVTAFPDMKTMRKYLAEIAWETEVWVADHPTHLIHFNGERFLGPY